MRIVIEPGVASAPFAQIRAQITDQARSGALPPGTRLPTVRELADRLGVAPGTVARAYKELEADRLIETRGRHGTFVSAGRDEAAREAFAAATVFVERVRRLGLTESAAIATVSAAFHAADETPVR